VSYHQYPKSGAAIPTNAISLSEAFRLFSNAEVGDDFSNVKADDDGDKHGSPVSPEVTALLAKMSALGKAELVFRDALVKGGLVALIRDPRNGQNLQLSDRARWSWKSSFEPFFVAELAAKRLELLRELVPGAARIAVLVNPSNVTTESVLRDMGQAARAMGLQIQVFKVSSIREIDAAFAKLTRERADGLFVANDPFFIDRRVQLAQLAARHALPAIHQDRLFAEVGGLMSYGASVGDALRQVGVYAGRILKGAKPADLPVVQPTKFELVINASTARMLGLAVPDKLLATADEVIE
jgi:putative tryptophan/tyrosine transport system substrate-binding protein